MVVTILTLINAAQHIYSPSIMRPLTVVAGLVIPVLAVAFVHGSPIDNPAQTGNQFRRSTSIAHFRRLDEESVAESLDTIVSEKPPKWKPKKKSSGAHRRRPAESSPRGSDSESNSRTSRPSGKRLKKSRTPEELERQRPLHGLFDPQYLPQEFIKTALDYELLSNETKIRTYLGNATNQQYDQFMGLFIYPKNFRHLTLPVPPLILRREYWLEALDKNHHSGLNHYFEIWAKEPRNQSFMEWYYTTNDDLPWRPRYLMDMFKVKYLNHHDRAQYEVDIKDGLLRNKTTGAVINTPWKYNVLKNPYIFVMDPFHRIYIGQKQSGYLQHSSFTAGTPVLAAGTIAVRNGKIQMITPWSGHYTPRTENMEHLYEHLTKHGVDLTKARFVKTFNPGFAQTLVNINKQYMDTKSFLKVQLYRVKHWFRNLITRRKNVVGETSQPPQESSRRIPSQDNIKPLPLANTLKRIYEHDIDSTRGWHRGARPSVSEDNR